MPLTITQHNWTTTEKLLFKFFFSWIAIFSLSFSFPHQLVNDIGYYTAPFFERVVKWFSDSILHLTKPYNTQLISDSTGFYVHALLVVFYSLIVLGIWTMIDKNRRTYHRLFYWLTAFIRYYLALQFFIYGFGKVFKWQFYLPEPNTLFTTVGDTHKDLLYWNVMGVSRSYNIFTGMLELIAAVSLLFKRTFIAGALLSFGVILNIVAINFGFDISVKLYSLFLLMLCIVLLAPAVTQLFRFFFLRQQVQLNYPNITFSAAKRNIYIIIKALAISLIMLEALYMYVKANNFNDDLAERPLLHGAYEVSSFVVNTDTIAPLLTNANMWKKVFVHRRGYFITQYMDDSMQDYELQYDTINKFFVLTDYEKKKTYQLHYEVQQNDKLFLRGVWNKDSLNIKLKKIDLRKLPLLQNEFNWTMDE